jgi:hypothetical protein
VPKNHVRGKDCDTINVSSLRSASEQRQSVMLLSIVVLSLSHQGDIVVLPFQSNVYCSGMPNETNVVPGPSAKKAISLTLVVEIIYNNNIMNSAW